MTSLNVSPRLCMRALGCLLLAGFALSTFAQLPDPLQMHYQARLTDAGGAALAGPRAIEITIHDQPTSGTALWGPVVFDPVELVDGTFTVLLGEDGQGRGLTDAFATGDAYLAMRHGEAGTTPSVQVTPRRQFASVPYALASGGIPGIGINEGLMTLQGLPGEAATLHAAGLNGNLNATLGPNEGGAGASLTLHDAAGNAKVDWDLDANEAGRVRLLGANGNPNVSFTSSADPNAGALRLHRADGGVAIDAHIDNVDAGIINVLGPNGSVNGALIRNSVVTNYGGLTVNNSSGAVRARIDVESNTAGAITVYGPNGNINVRATISSGVTNHGWLGVYNSAGSVRAQLRIETNGTGRVVGDSKNFIIDHPVREGHQLIHASIEGPETAVYYRGEARLEGGRATVRLPDYFESLARGEGRTIQLSPAAGWAPLYVASGIKNGAFEVATTADGNPNAAFHWEVKAVRADLTPLEVEISNKLSLDNEAPELKNQP